MPTIITLIQLLYQNRKLDASLCTTQAVLIAVFQCIISFLRSAQTGNYDAS